MWLYIVLFILSIYSVIFFALGFHHRPQYIQNYEKEEYGRGHPYTKPFSINHGLAVYRADDDEPLLLFPFPHSHTIEPMAQTSLAEIFTWIGRTVVTFDPPGAYPLSRKATGRISEMIDCANKTLDRLGVQVPLEVVGHSMCVLCALAYAIERPERIRRLVLVASLSGFNAAAR